MDKKALIKKLAITLGILVLLLILVLVIPADLITGAAISEIPDKKIHTKALCDENNFCQDYKITCENSKVQETTPISGATIQHSENWEDPRPNPEGLC